MNDRVIRVGEVAGILGIAKSTVWLWDSQGKLPKSFKLTAATTVWRLSEIMDWLDEKQAETQDKEEDTDTVQIKNNSYTPKPQIRKRRVTKKPEA